MMNKSKIKLSPAKEEFIAQWEVKHFLANELRNIGLLTVSLQLVILAKLFNLF